jgi:hypothetical protein
MYKEYIVWFVKSVTTIVQGWRHPWDHAHGHGHAESHEKVHQLFLLSSLYIAVLKEEFQELSGQVYCNCK